MSLRDDISETALQHVSAHVDKALREQQSGRPLSSIRSGGSHGTGESYVKIGEVPTHIAAVYYRTSRGTLTSSRLRGARASPAAGAAGLIGGV